MDLFKEKYQFIYENSKIIYEKLNQNDIDTLNEIQNILLCDYSIEEIAELNYSYHKIFNLRPKLNNNFYTISIIFRICTEIEQSNLDIKTKRMLRDKIRIYTKYCEADNNDLKKNKQFIILKK